MTGVLALAPNFWPYACIAFGILAAIATGEKSCRGYFRRRFGRRS